AHRGALRRRARRTRPHRRRDPPSLSARSSPRASAARCVRSRWAGARPVALLLRDPPARDRDRAPDPVRRADSRRALGPLRLPRARAAADLARARVVAHRPDADRRALAGREARRPRRRSRRPGRDQPGGIRAPRRTWSAPARSDLPLRLGFLLRHALLVDPCALVEL